MTLSNQVTGLALQLRQAASGWRAGLPMWSWAAVLAPPHREHPWPQRVNHFSSCPAGSTHFRGVRNAPPRASALPFCLLRQVGWLRTRPVARLLQATRVPCLSSRTRGKIQNLATEGPASPAELRHRHWKEAAAPLATSTTGRVHPSLPHPSFLLTRPSSSPISLQLLRPLLHHKGFMCQALPPQRRRPRLPEAPRLAQGHMGATSWH